MLKNKHLMTTHAAHSSSLSAVAVTAVATGVDISEWLVARGLSSCPGRDKPANCRLLGRFCFYGAMFPAAGMVCSSSFCCILCWEFVDDILAIENAHCLALALVCLKKKRNSCWKG